MVVADLIRRQDTSAVAAVDAGLFDVLHDPTDHDSLNVADGIDVNFDRILQELIDQDWPVLGHADRLGHITAQGAFVIDNRHGPSTEHKRGAHDGWIANTFGDL